MEKIKIGVISFEHMHALSYTNALKSLPQVELVGIADSDTGRGTIMASRFNTSYFKDYKELLNMDLDGVIICTCNKLHAETVVEAAKAKKHILVEKPFATNYEDAKVMLEAAKENGVKLLSAFPMRYNQAVIEAKAAVDRGDIGDILCITGINHGKIPSGWFLDKDLAGGGAVIDHTVHVADLMRWFTGSECKSVYAESGELIHNKGIDDCGIVNVEFENGVFGTIDCSWGHHKNYTIWPEVYMEIVGTKGVLEVDAFRQTERVYSIKDNSIDDNMWASGGDEGLIREFIKVIEAAKAGEVREGSHHATGLDGERAMEIAVAAYKSSNENKVVKVEHLIVQ
jgi:predicted dehydrogenase